MISSYEILHQMRCDLCGIEEPIPFACRYCKGTFCSVHRLPPNHDCIFIKDYLEQPVRDREFLEHIHGKSTMPQERIKFALYDMIFLRFSKTEALHLAIATALVTAVGVSSFGFQFRSSILMFEYITIFVSAFVIHELGHKFLAQFYRAWAEFRLMLFGAVITALSALPFFPFKFIAPGVVWHSGNLSQSRSGKVSWIGPLTNIAMGTGFMLAFLFMANTPGPNQILITGVRFNGFIAFFNLIPFMGLDGQKIFSWNKLIWLLTFAAAIGIFIWGDLAGGGFTTGLFRRFL